MVMSWTPAYAQPRRRSIELMALGKQTLLPVHVGCCVKKRVERDREDDSYVLTTYEGNHSHPPPGEFYYPIPRAHDAGAASAAGAQGGPSGGSF